MVPALVLAVVYLVWAPPSADLAAQAFRTHVFAEHGFEVWTNAWYSGIHLPGYSLLFTPLAALLGERVTGALAVVATAWCFERLVRPRYGDRARLAAWLFGAGAAANLFTGRLTFALGLALAIAALLALDRRREVAAGVLAALSTFGSPVAGLFVVFAGGVLFLAGHRRQGPILAVPAAAAIGVAAFGFPTGGVEPFVANTFTLIVPGCLLVFLVLPREERTLRLGALLYLAMCVALFAIDTPVGGNATRLGSLAAAPLVALAWGRRPALLVAAALVPLVYWQWVAPVRDLTDAVGEPSVERTYYEPLLEELDRRADSDPFRVHVTPTRNRWEANYVAREYPLARGWLRQAEADDFELFQDGDLTPEAYREWLGEHAVRFVAVPTRAEPDYLAEDEIELLRAGVPGVEAVWEAEGWELYEVDDPAPLADPPARVVELGDDSFELAGPPGEHVVRVTPSPYWRVTAGEGCVRADGDRLVVELERGPLRAEADFSLAGLWRALTRRDAAVCSA
ncbi:MAG TPA: hypothetical protein VIL04_04320 [Solirubrobacterales bacterium]